MRAAIQALISPDVDLDSYSPSECSRVDVFIQVFAGPAGSEGTESFGLEVVTPDALKDRIREDGPLVGRFLVIVEKWDWPTIERYIRDLFENEEAETWPELAERLARYGHWEFEDYREFDPNDEPA